MADKTFKVTKGMNKQYFAEVLTKNIPVIEQVVLPEGHENLRSRVVYANDHPEEASCNDLRKLVKEVYAVLGDQFVEVPVPQTENSVKKSTKTPEKPKTVAEDPRVVPFATAAVFPETFTSDMGDTFHILHDEVKSLEDMLTDPDENGERVLNGTYVFAFWWTKRHLRQFPYFNDDLGHPNEFAQYGTKDLDFAQAIYVSNKGRVAYAVSELTEVPYTIFPADLEEIDGVRIGSRTSIEFAVYKMDEDEDEDTEDEDDAD